MKRQGGFTLIEMIVVIVILGILAVTAAPRFLNFQDDARDAALEGLRGAINSAGSMVQGKYLINGKDGDNKVDGVLVASNGYPAATSAGISKAIVGVAADANDTTSDWKVHATDTNVIEYTFNNSQGGSRCVVYTNASANATDIPTTEVKACS
ncbi:type II secretion system GspH family protein [Grimontia kaedaensis]|uniref:Type II secretion system GspH family protein n=1 Tax=Grimontia kaedaensis TaxID=2872157 RepID=A0ABY4WW40_9GAMM|nr:type II secretion system protein [Grimontia kaedaensis]USH02766.1 type II secretion system GspH family protein [Grimontia kaedaensis]